MIVKWKKQAAAWFGVAVAVVALTGNVEAQGIANGWKPVAADTATRRAAPGFVQSAEVWRLERPLSKVPLDDPARNMFFGASIRMGFAGLEAGSAYELELTFLSDSSDRTVRVSANGCDLEAKMALPVGEALRKRWRLPVEILAGDGELVVEVSRITGPNAVLSGATVYADKAEAKSLVPLPPRVNAKMVAWETAARHSLNSFVQVTNVWKIGGMETQIAVADPLREVFFDRDAIKIVLTGAESTTGYGAELSFLSDSDDRAVRISAGGIVLKDTLALPKARIMHKYFLIPSEAIKEGRIEITVAKVSGTNVVLSEIAVFADKAQAKALAALPAAPLPADWIPDVRLTQRPSAVAGVKAAKLDLNGTWKFNPAPPAEFGTAAAETFRDWKDIQVPGEWTMQGFKVEPKVAAGYSREFSVPQDWKGRRVKLRCDAVYSEAKVWVNGQEAGSHLGGFTPFELDVTRFLKAGAINTVTLSVKNESLADSLSCGSQYAAHPLGGIPRKIYLFTVPEVNIADLYARTEFDRDFVNATLIACVKIANDSQHDSAAGSFELLLAGADGAAKPLDVAVPAIKAGQSFTSELRMPVASPRKWDSEHPNLYALTALLKDAQGAVAETVNKRIGFRQVEVRGNQLFVNNAQVKLRGVCRHETHPLLGRATTPELCRKDVELFRAMNVNHIRTSHYPPQEEFIEACDELGMFVELEAPFVWVNDAHAMDALNLPFILQTEAETVLRDRSAPSVIMWSLGNESQWGRNFEASMALARTLDGSRPCLFDSGGPGLYEKGNHPQPLVDIDAPHYPGLAGFEKRFDGNPRPTLLGEYAHLNCYNRRQFMTDPGLRDFWGEGIAEMWEHMLATRSCLGGNVWAAIDDFFFLPSGDTVGYGNWGPLDGWRRAKPEYWHLKKIYSPVRIAVSALPAPAAGSPVGIPVENRHFFSNLGELRFVWAFDGQTGTVANVAVAPGAKGELRVPIAGKNPDGKVLELKAFSPQGGLVDAWRFTIGPVKLAKAKAIAASKVALAKTAETLAVQCGDAHWVLDAKTGLIQQAATGGKPVLIGGPTLMLLPLGDDSNGCTQLQKKEYVPVKALCSGWKASKVVARETADSVEIEVDGEYAEARGRFLLTFTGDGRLAVAYDFKLKVPLDSWQLGVVLDLPRQCDTLSWKRKAQWSYYPDDHISRAEGTAKAFTGKPRVDILGPHAQPDWSWSLDETEMGSNDFCSMKRNVIEALLCAPDGNGLRVLGGGVQHVRCWIDGDRARLLVADYANAGRGCCMNEYVVPFRPLRPGDAVAGKVVLETRQADKSF